MERKEVYEILAICTITILCIFSIWNVTTCTDTEVWSIISYNGDPTDPFVGAMRITDGEIDPFGYYEEQYPDRYYNMKSDKNIILVSHDKNILGRTIHTKFDFYIDFDNETRFVYDGK